MQKIITRVLLFIAVLLGLTPVTLQAQTKELTNLVVFVRFADDAEINRPLAPIDSMFNGRTPGYLSVYNFYDVMTYGRIHYNTVYTNNVQNGVIISYQDSYPRGYFEPYKGGTGAWASILWPHMEFFPYDSLDYEPRINGLKLNTFNFEFEGSVSYFTPHVFRHEMGHSLSLPDLYHYINYQDVTPAGDWDMMCSNTGNNHTAAIFKNKILHVSDDPIEITESGDYTLLSVGSSPSRNCYYIKSHIDPTQWYVLEYRSRNDLFDESIPGSGLIVARWNDTVPLNYEGLYTNGFFDFYNRAHQYWIFRPGSSSDIENGLIDRAHFSQLVGRTSFGPTTDPHPYLTDGTPETCFKITGIYDHGDSLTFHVHFFDAGIEDNQLAESIIVYPNPATEVVNVECRMQNEEWAVTNMEVYDVYGKVIRTAETLRATSPQTAQINVSGLAAGMYFVRVTTDKGVLTKRFVKR